MRQLTLWTEDDDLRLTDEQKRALLARVKMMKKFANEQPEAWRIIAREILEKLDRAGLALLR